MNPYIGVVRTDRHSDDLSTGPDGPNSLTRQFYDTDDAPREPLTGPVTWNTAPSSIYNLLIHLRQCNHNLRRCCGCCTHENESRPHPLITPVIWRYCFHCHRKFCAGHRFWLDLTHRFELDLTQFLNAIQLTFNVFIFDSSQIIW